MITAILITVVFIAGSVIALFYWQRVPRRDEHNMLAPPRDPRGLFDEQAVEIDANAPTEEEAERVRGTLLERARLSDLSALDEAARADRDLYNEVLNELARRAADDYELFRLLVTHITESKQLRSNARIARALIEGLKHDADRRQTAEMLVVAALSDDAAVYEEAVERALETWRDGQPSDLTAAELLALVESQYWVLGPEARRSGAGFALRQTLERSRRLLAEAARAR